MKNLVFESTTILRFDAPISEHHFLLRSIPPSYPGQQIISSTLELIPDAPYALFEDGLGNLTETGYIKEPHTEFVYRVSGVAQIEEARLVQELLRPIYKYPSTYTHMSQEMKAYVESISLCGNDLQKAIQLAEAIFSHMTYRSGVTSTTTTASEAFAMRQGVCQDYSHIFIAMARYVGIPARYVNGLPLGSGPSHAWVEVHVRDEVSDGIENIDRNYGKWIGIDPTQNRLVGEDYVRFCQGRDFLDCALERGILVGSASQNQETMTIVSEQ